MSHDEHELETYGDPGITSLDAKVPTFLKWTYITLPIWGIVTFIIYWNGSSGWLDRGYWRQLQNAAKTTFPIVHYNENDSNHKTPSQK